MDPTGEVLHIFGGITLGGIFGFGGGIIGSIIDQKKRGRKVDWRKAFGSGINGAITGAAQGGLLASGAGLPTALLTNFFAGAAGSAAEQYIGTGTVDPGSSITRGLTNAVSNAIYGTNPLRSARDAFLRGAGAGAATSGINYLSDFMGQGNRLSGRRPGITPGWQERHSRRMDCMTRDWTAAAPIRLPPALAIIPTEGISTTARNRKAARGNSACGTSLERL